MSDLFTIPPSSAATTQAQAPSNVPVQSVSDVAQGVKRTVEAAFGRVRIRGEVSRPNYHRSGHLYLTLKDDRAVIDAVSWKGQVSKLGFRVEEGMEVIATGKLTTYPGGSKYQIVIDTMDIAGEGALLKMLEDRRKKLAAEGLFADERKKPLPLLPNSIGVVTSPTGAVIRDILHRLADRFPRDVLLWPVSVQGDNAAAQIAKAIDGFNALPADGPVKRPDLLIVGRGGGSLEDLWCFNEEIVVRAVADSQIPIISAVGHETDTTLIDFASDRRAPTPTGAAEMAVPVRTDELIKLGDLGQRLAISLRRKAMALSTEVEGLSRGLGQPARLIQDRMQTLNLADLALDSATQKNIALWRQRFDALAGRLPHPREKVRGMTQAFTALDAKARMKTALHQNVNRQQQQLDALGRVLESLKNARDQLMDQGYIYVTDTGGGIVRRTDQVRDNMPMTLHFRDGKVDAIAKPGAGAAAAVTTAATATAGDKPATKPKPKSANNGDQGTLL